MEVGRQGANFFDLGWRTDQNKLVLVVESAQRAHHIADICADAELGHPPYVDGDLHGRHLTIEQAYEHSGIMPSPRPGLSPGVLHRAETPRRDRAPVYGSCSAPTHRCGGEELRRSSGRSGSSRSLSCHAWLMLDSRCECRSASAADSYRKESRSC